MAQKNVEIDNSGATFLGSVKNFGGKVQGNKGNIYMEKSSVAADNKIKKKEKSCEFSRQADLNLKGIKNE